jgi:hypothetical protein
VNEDLFAAKETEDRNDAMLLAYRVKWRQVLGKNGFSFPWENDSVIKLYKILSISSLGSKVTLMSVFVIPSCSCLLCAGTMHALEGSKNQDRNIQVVFGDKNLGSKDLFFLWSQV